MAQPIRLALRPLDLFALIDKLFLASATLLPQLLDLCRIVIKAAESIEQPAVELRIHQSALVVLPMDFYEGRSQHPQGLGAHRRVIDKGTRASVGELDTPQDQLVLRRDAVRCQELAHRVCWRRLERRCAQAPILIEPVVKAFDAALRALDEVRGQLAAALRAGDCDPLELERVEERLFGLRAAARKYNVPVDDLNALGARYAADLRGMDASAARLAALEEAARDAADRYGNAAMALSRARKTAAENLERSVNPELRPLRLERAAFSVQIASEPDAGGPHGIDHVEFWVQTNPGTRPGPLMKIVSGGELARFLLALKAVLADRGSAPTLVFDEIDTGAGGAVADAIGVRLARLAGRAQVIAVTHAPQVAARADRHYLISKGTVERGRRVATRVTEVAAETRREEIARMLAGAKITAEARAAAERLLQATG